MIKHARVYMQKYYAHRRVGCLFIMWHGITDKHLLSRGHLSRDYLPLQTTLNSESEMELAKTYDNATNAGPSKLESSEKAYKLSL